MATIREKLRWKFYLMKERLIYDYGFKTGLIGGYDVEFIENLRNIYYGPFPLSLLILDVEGCIGKCYDRALLATFGFLDDDFVQVDADIDSITYNVFNIDDFRNSLGNLPIHYGNHSFIERTLKNGNVLVYDTTFGLVYDKSIYYLLNRPKVTRINDKNEVEMYIEHKDIVNNNKNGMIDKDKYLLPTLLLIFERKVREGSGMYKSALLEEIELFKRKIGYDDICMEVMDDMLKLRVRKL